MGIYNHEFYKNKKVLITGHTGFKGSWLCSILLNAGAEVTGYSLEPPTVPSLYSLAGIERNVRSVIGDIRDLERLDRVFDEVCPEIVIHMAAQPIVREGLTSPVYTYETNVMGTVNICECVRRHESVRSFINVTTDKVYENKEWAWGYRESDVLNGNDPYSNSKSCSELVTDSYNKTYFRESGVAASTVRAGNVIGGGDFAPDRILPDCIRAALDKKDILIRNPSSVRPYQHVLEAISVYMMIAEKQYENLQYAGSYNVGPDSEDCVTTARLADMFCQIWGYGLNWKSCAETNSKEASVLRLDCSLLKNTFDWRPRWRIRDAVEKTVEWAREWDSGGDIPLCMDAQIREFGG